MRSNLTPDTAFAILHATQSETAKAAHGVKNAQREKDLEKAEFAAREFEAVFISEMMKPMFEGVSTDGAFGGGHAEEVFRGMLLQEYGKLISRTGSIGLADQVKAQMIQMQEQIDKGATVNDPA